MSRRIETTLALLLPATLIFALGGAFESWRASRRHLKNKSACVFSPLESKIAIDGTQSPERIVLTPVKQYSVSFTSDGIATEITFDASLVPINENFRGNIPTGLLLPVVGPAGGAPISGVTADLEGTTITLTFVTAPPQYDENNNLIIYVATFYLQFPN
jgi:hypothetical protein